jgi:hypothetical protein
VEIFWTGAHVNWDGLHRPAVMFSDKATFLAKAKPYHSRIANYKGL